MSKPNKDRVEPEVPVAPFFKIPKAVVESGLLAILKPSEVKVYLVIASYAHFEGRYCFPSVASIAEKSGVGKNLIGKATRRLMALGLITKKRAPRAFKFKNVYHVVDDPQIESIFIPLKTDKRIRKARGNQGRWGVIPRNTESGICPQKTEVVTCPGNTDKKEIERDLKRDSYKSAPIFTISKKTRKEYEALWGKEKTEAYMRDHGYVVDPAEENASVSEK